MDLLQTLLQQDRRHIWHPFTRDNTKVQFPIIESANGALLYSKDGKEYIDMISSWWVTLHGHTHPAIVRAVSEQAMKLEQVIFAGFTHEGAIILAHNLSSLLPEDLNRVFFSDDGSTAVEVALKIAHQYWRNVGLPERCRFLAYKGGYHGDTIGAMSVGVHSGFFKHFTDMMFEVTTLPFPFTWEGDSEITESECISLAALDNWLEDFGRETAALIIEPLIQGAGGMRMCRPQFLRNLVERCRASGVLLIFDEVMTGFGRTGQLFAALTAHVTPDIICLAKGLTGGFLPMAVTVCRDHIYDAFSNTTLENFFAHGHSFTANPLACAAALESLHLLTSDKTRAALQTIEQLHRARLLQGLAKHPLVRQPRVTGTVAAFNVLEEKSGSIVGQHIKDFCMARGLLLRPLNNVIYLLPPYCITQEQLSKSYDLIEEALSEIRG